MEFGRRRDGHDLAPRLGVCGFFVRFFEIRFLRNFKIDGGSWNSAASRTIASRVPTSSYNRRFGYLQLFLLKCIFLEILKNRSGSWHLVASGMVALCAKLWPLS